RCTGEPRPRRARGRVMHAVPPIAHPYSPYSTVTQDIFPMSTEIKVPVLPESASDATIATWHKKPGDTVRRDENLVDIETDKVVLEVPSPVDGVLKEIKFQTGDTVTSEQLLAIVEEGAVAAETKADNAIDVKNDAAAADVAQPVQPRAAAAASAGTSQ